MKSSRFALNAVWVLIACAAIAAWSGNRIDSYLVGIAILTALMNRWQAEGQ